MTLESLLNDWEAKAPRFPGEAVNLVIIPGKGTCRVEVRQPDLSFRGCNAPTMAEALTLALTGGTRKPKPKPVARQPQVGYVQGSDDLGDVI